MASVGAALLRAGLALVVFAMAVATAAATTTTPVYAGGLFRNAGSVALHGGFTQWSGSAWSVVGSPLLITGDVLALAEFQGQLYVGGSFANGTDGTAVVNIARWNPATQVWSTFGAGAEGSYVLAFATYGSYLVIAGSFYVLDNAFVSSIGLFDGTTVTEMAQGLDNNVNAVVEFQGALYAGGIFSSSGGTIPLSRVAKWDGSAWSALTTGVNSDVWGLASYGGLLYVGGGFGTAGGLAISALAAWNGAAWLNPGPITGYSQVHSFLVHNGLLYMGGGFASVNGTAAFNIAIFNGTAWSAMGDALTDQVFAIANDANGVIYAGGYFVNGNLSRIAAWNGSAWLPMLEGVDGDVRALYAGPITPYVPPSDAGRSVSKGVAIFASTFACILSVVVLAIV